MGLEFDNVSNLFALVLFCASLSKLYATQREVIRKIQLLYLHLVYSILFQSYMYLCVCGFYQSNRGLGHVIWWGTLRGSKPRIRPPQHQCHNYMYMYNSDIDLPSVQSVYLSVCLSVIQFPFGTTSMQLPRL